MTKKDLIILGAGGHAKVVADAAQAAGSWRRIAFLDDTLQGDVMGLPILGNLQYIGHLHPSSSDVVVGLGAAALRMKWLDRAQTIGFSLATVIHPCAYTSKHATVDEGSVIFAGCVVNPGARVGRGCILNTGCTVDHDCVLEDGVHISPGAHLGGNVTVGTHGWICAGACIAHGVSVGAYSIVAAGAAVVQDIPDRVLVAGVPAQIKKRTDSIS